MAGEKPYARGQEKLREAMQPVRVDQLANF